MSKTTRRRPGTRLATALHRDACRRTKRRGRGPCRNVATRQQAADIFARLMAERLTDVLEAAVRGREQRRRRRHSCEAAGTAAPDGYAADRHQRHVRRQSGLYPDLPTKPPVDFKAVRNIIRGPAGDRGPSTLPHGTIAELVSSHAKEPGKRRILRPAINHQPD